MQNNTRALPNLLRSRSFQLFQPAESSAAQRTPCVIRGRANVTAVRELVLDLAGRTGQTASLGPIDLLVRSPAALRKRPSLVLVRLRPPWPDAAEPYLRSSGHAPGYHEGYNAAVLLYEYRLAGAPTGLFSTDDIFGERTVLAPPGLRIAAAEAACRILIANGAIACLVSVDGSADPPPCVNDQAARCEFGWRIRTKERDLCLASSFEETLRALGPSTRHNLRRYRSRAEEDLAARFLSDAAITPDDLLELNQNSTNPVPEDVARWRWQLAYTQPDRIFAGLRDHNGRWLSVISGYRQGDRAILEWQTNRAGLQHHSICTALRSFLIERETALGTRTVSFQGGTHHTLALSLRPAPTTDVIAVTRDLRGDALRRLAHRLLPPSNFLGRALADPEVTWRAGCGRAL